MTTQTPPVATKNSNTPAPTGAATPVTAKPETLAMQAKSIVDIVEGRISEFIKTGQLHMPKDYSVSNALKSAWLILQTVEDKDHNKALTVCTRDSVANSLLDMIVQGLNPGKKQNYFIIYGKTLICQRSYFGSMAVAQMVNQKIGEFAYAVVYEGDVFKYGIENGKKIITKHEQDIKNVNKQKIVAAYCIVFDQEGTPMKTEIMTWAEIIQSWRQSKTAFDDKGELKASSTHAKFTADMVLRTIINKTCKIIINASSDNALLLERINRNEDLSDAAATQVEIEEHANTGAVLQIPAEKIAGEIVNAEFHDDAQEKSVETPVCVCDQFLKEKATEWDCGVHGRYQGGRFSKPEPKQQRKPGF